MDKLVAFSTGHLNERGSDVALYNYALYNEKLLGNKSVVIASKNEVSELVLEKFQEQLTVKLFSNEEEHARLIKDADLYYVLTVGRRNPKGAPLPKPENGKLGVHAIFKADDPHGDIYATISEWVANNYGPGEENISVVPHIVHLPNDDGNLREELGIPEDAVVFGRHGAYDQFNDPAVKKAIKLTLLHRRESAPVYFLFLNTEPFVADDRAIFLRPIIDEVTKVRFINSCDAMIYGRQDGETFGLAVGEFSIRNKPVIASNNCLDKAHIDYLGDRRISFNYTMDLYDTLITFVPSNHKVWDKYSHRFSPSSVMKKFEETFLG